MSLARRLGEYTELDSEAGVKLNLRFKGVDIVETFVEFDGREAGSGWENGVCLELKHTLD